MQYELEFPEILCHNHTCHGLSLTEYPWEFHNNALWDTLLLTLQG